MKTSLNGAGPIGQQSLDLQNAEAARHVLLSIFPDLERPPWNTAVLRPLTPTEPRSAPLSLSTTDAPDGKIVFWMGNIYVEGKLTSVVAYR